WGAQKPSNPAKKAVPHKLCGELPTAEIAASLASRGFSTYLPNSPHFTDTHAHIFLAIAGGIKSS
ncbi:MAG: hypothetical protein ACXWF8_10580, partial [Methylobacter sp.]